MIFKIEMSDAEAVILIAKRDSNAVAIAEHVTGQRVVGIASKAIGAVRWQTGLVSPARADRRRRRRNRERALAGGTGLDRHPGSSARLAVKA
jgi:hypothetical protein